MIKHVLILAVMGLAIHARAQTNSAASTNASEAGSPALAYSGAKGTNSHARAETEIYSDSGEVNLTNRIAIHTGHVRVIDPQMRMTCEVLTARLPSEGNKVDYILAETNVVIDAVDNDGKPVHAWGDKALYVYRIEGSVTNETIELSGHARLESDKGSVTGEPIIWDLINKKVTYRNNRVSFAIPEKTESTNAPANKAAEPKP